MELEKTIYDLLTNNKHLVAVKYPENENYMITRKDLKIYYRLKIEKEVIKE